MRVPAETAELEGHAKRRRRAGEVLSTEESFERWGPKDDEMQADAIHAAGREAGATVEAAERALEALVPELRQTNPQALEAWVSAHHALLDEFLARTDDHTGRSVATEERAKWSALLAGEVDRVRQNTYWVKYDPVLYEALFGFPY